MKALSSRFSGQAAAPSGLIRVRKIGEFCAHCGAALHHGEWFRYEFEKLSWEERTARTASSVRPPAPRPICDLCRKRTFRRSPRVRLTRASTKQPSSTETTVLVVGLTLAAACGVVLGLLRVLGIL